MEEKIEGTKIIAKLEIELYSDGNARITGPLPNKALCKGMLAMAQQIVDEWRPQIMRPEMGPLPAGGAKILPFPRQ